jgi:parallel beta-helix repeat protein
MSRGTPQERERLKKYEPYSVLISQTEDNAYIAESGVTGELLYGPVGKADEVFQAAIDSFPHSIAGGGVINIRRGSYLLYDTVYVHRSGLTFRGEGSLLWRPTEIKLADGVNKDMFQVGLETEGAADTRFMHLSLEGNKNNNPTHGKGIYVYPSSGQWSEGGLLFDVFVHNTREEGIHSTNGYWTFIRVTTDSCGVAGLHLSHYAVCNILYDYDSYHDTAKGIVIEWPAHDAMIVASRVTHAGLTGLETNALRTIITASKFTENNYVAIQTLDSSSGIIQGCDVYNGIAGGIYIRGRDWIIANNRVFDNDQGGAGFAGVVVQVGSGDARNILIHGNELFDDQATPTQNSGLYVETPTHTLERLVVTDNIVYGNEVEQIHIPAGADVVVRNNRGYATEASGTATILNGKTSVTFAHGLAGTPTLVVLGATHAEVADAVWSADATNITITVPSAVTANRKISWYAEYHP